MVAYIPPFSPPAMTEAEKKILLHLREHGYLWSTFSSGRDGQPADRYSTGYLATLVTPKLRIWAHRDTSYYGTRGERDITAEVVDGESFGVLFAKAWYELVSDLHDARQASKARDAAAQAKLDLAKAIELL